MNKIFDQSSKYYDIIYSKKDYLAEANFIEKIINNFNPTVARILDLGCGTGKHAKILASNEVHVKGLDQSIEMINIANSDCIENKLNVEFCVGNILNFNEEVKFDVVISMFDVVSYLTSYEELDEFFKNSNQALENEGILIFDCWFGPAVYSNKPGITVKRFSSSGVNITRLAEGSLDTTDNTVSINYDIYVDDGKKIERIKEFHKVRCFFQDEIEYRLKINGFKLLKITKWFSESEPSVDSWNCLYIARKEENI